MKNSIRCLIYIGTVVFVIFVSMLIEKTVINSDLPLWLKFWILK
jgi:hypothetical protein